MLLYLLTRILRSALGILLILFVSYGMMFYGAGDPIKKMYLDKDDLAVDEVTLTALREKYGLDDPFLVQFTTYLGNLAQGNMGISIREQRPVADMVRATLPISVQMGLAATALATLIGIPLGILAARKHNSPLDYAIVAGVTAFNAVPVFVIGPLLILFFVSVLGIMKVPWGWDGLFSPKTILPLAALTMVPLPIVVRQTRSAILEVRGEDYIRTARAKGLSERDVAFRHMLRPVLLPVITSVGLVAITLINGAIFVELIFGIPGFGGLTLEGLLNVDYPVIMATVLIGALIVMVTNLAVELAYPLLDARVTKGH
jgi:ABC-type dipeptide/oligopeptide/nickel transport system permease component